MSLFGKVVYHAATAVRGERQIWSYLDRLRELQTQPTETLRALQAQKLHRLMAFARDNVDHYRRLGLAVSADAEGAEQMLSNWPLLEKSVLQSSSRALRSEYADRVAVKSTGGSTGAPVRLVKNADGMAQERAASWLALGWYGVGVGDRVVRFWGTPLTRKRRWAFRLADLAMNRKRVSAFEFEAADLERHWKRLMEFQPVWIYGYSTPIQLFARWMEETGRSGSIPSVRLIVPTAEPVTQQLEAEVERGFAASVQNEYGCGEVGAIAYACKAKRLHIMTANVLVEILREDGTLADIGEAGEVVVTDLTNYAMPLIRYRLGDRAAALGACSCSLPFPTLSRVEGRSRDVIVTPRGRRVYGGKIHYHMTNIGQTSPGFRQYQFIQTGERTVEIRLVLDSMLTSEIAERLKRFAADELDGIEVRLRQVDRIERAPSGKLRLVKNEWLEQMQERN